jgi:hypothetical protein
MTENSLTAVTQHGFSLPAAMSTKSEHHLEMQCGIPRIGRQHSTQGEYSHQEASTIPRSYSPPHKQ